MLRYLTANNIKIMQSDYINAFSFKSYKDIVCCCRIRFHLLARDCNNYNIEKELIYVRTSIKRLKNLPDL